jgi:hypothetical protein
MQNFSTGEHLMWQSLQAERPLKMSDKEINEKYIQREKRIVTESNREKLPNFVEALQRQNYMDLRPFYQRRERWDVERQSKLIESFIINIPVPPLFLYEKDYNSYEVMDGQQRITTIKDFYNNEFKLKGLQLWPELNGKSYSTLPSKIRDGIDRRSISYFVLMKESAENEVEELVLKQLVFERLNTGGVELGNQEIRNALYQGKFNSLLVELSRSDIFRKAWNIPLFSEEENKRPPQELLKNKLFQTMEDLEIILRFFAIRHFENYRKGMQGFLDLYMIRARTFNQSDIDFLRNLYVNTLRTAHSIYGDLLFRPFNPEKGIWEPRAQRAFYDSVMVGISINLDIADLLIQEKAEVVNLTKHLFSKFPEGTFTGRGNTKEDVKNRIIYFSDMLKSAVKK